jgi:hypothetical protein
VASQTLPLYILIPSCKTKQNAFFSGQGKNWNFCYDAHVDPPLCGALISVIIMS